MESRDMNAGGDHGGAGNNQEQDRYLPIANIGRIMKDSLKPRDDAKIAKDARETVQECVSDFITFITSEACDNCINEKRRTISGKDLIFALKQLGFERYCENLEAYRQKYEQVKRFQEEHAGVQQDGKGDAENENENNQL